MCDLLSNQHHLTTILTQRNVWKLNKHNNTCFSNNKWTFVLVIQTYLKSNDLLWNTLFVTWYSVNMIYTDVIITVYLILSGNHDQIYTNLRNEERFKLNSEYNKSTKQRISWELDKSVYDTGVKKHPWMDQNTLYIFTYSNFPRIPIKTM